MYLQLFGILKISATLSTGIILNLENGGRYGYNYQWQKVACVDPRLRLFGILMISDLFFNIIISITWSS